MHNLFLYVSCFACQSKGVNFGNEVFDVCCENKIFNQTSDSPQEATVGLVLDANYFSFSNLQPGMSSPRPSRSFCAA